MGLRELFAGSEGAFVRRCLLLLALGSGLLLVPSVPALHDVLERAPAVLLLCEHLGVALIVALVVIVFIELGLRKEFLADVEAIFVERQPSSYLKSFRGSRICYEDAMASDIERIRPTETVRVVGISHRVLFADRPGVAGLAKKVRDGCHLRFVLLHPESTLLPAIENLSRDFGYPDLKQSLRVTACGAIAQLCTVLSTGPSVSGSLEIRLHRDVFSSLFCYSGPRMTIVGLYLSHADGVHSPAFEVTNVAVLSQVNDHFDTLWEASRGNVLLSVSGRGVVDNLEQVFPSPHRGHAGSSESTLSSS